MLTTDQKVQVVMEGQERLIRKLETVEQEVKRSRKVRVYTNFGLALLLMIVWPFSLNNVTDGVEREAYFATYDAVLHYLDTREAPDPYAEFLEENQ